MSNTENYTRLPRFDYFVYMQVYLPADFLLQYRCSKQEIASQVAFIRGLFAMQFTNSHVQTIQRVVLSLRFCGDGSRGRTLRMAAAET